MSFFQLFLCKVKGLGLKLELRVPLLETMPAMVVEAGGCKERRMFLTGLQDVVTNQNGNKPWGI